MSKDENSIKTDGEREREREREREERERERGRERERDGEAEPEDTYGHNSVKQTRVKNLFKLRVMNVEEKIFMHKSPAKKALDSINASRGNEPERRGRERGNTNRSDWGERREGGRGKE